MPIEEEFNTLHSNLDVGYGWPPLSKKLCEGKCSPTVIEGVKIVKFYTAQSNTGSQHMAHHREINFLLPKFEINMASG